MGREGVDIRVGVGLSRRVEKINWLKVMNGVWIIRACRNANAEQRFSILPAYLVSAHVLYASFGGLDKEVRPQIQSARSLSSRSCNPNAFG